MSAAAAAARDRESPWRFLDALGFDSAADRQLVRLTRGAELQVLTNLVRSSKASVLYAYSGNGKSSLINAGLIPNLLEAEYVLFRTRPRPPFATASPIKAFKECMLREMWLPELAREDRNLPQELMQATAHVTGEGAERIAELIERLSSQWARVSTPGSIRAAYIDYMQSRMDLPLAEFITATQKFFGSEVYMLFICDQFEEAFVHYLNQPVLHEFVGQIGKTFSDTAIHAQFLFSMREDWVGNMLELRKDIPEILSNMYQLPPIRRTAAAPVLEYPLEALNLGFESGVVDRILTDLSEFYSVLQRRQQYTALRLSRSPEKDPYLELPALQVVAEKLWETRNRVSVAFSAEHYEKLPKLLAGGKQPQDPDGQAQSWSPARQVLEGYLGDLLTQISGDGVSEPVAAERRDLQIDLLYALTDGSAHRRALPRDELMAECTRNRFGALFAPLDEQQLTAALDPLVKARLVRPGQGRGGIWEYELAHDFLVRSVAALWKDLDRQRAARLAMERQARGEMERFRKGQRRVHLSMIWLPLVLLASVVLSGVMADQQRRAEASVLMRSAQVLAGELDEVVNQSVAELVDLNRRHLLLNALMSGPLALQVRYQAARDHVNLEQLETDQLLAVWLAGHFTAPQLAALVDNSLAGMPQADRLLSLLRRTTYADDLIAYAEWQDFAAPESPTWPGRLGEIQSQCRSFEARTKALQRADYAWSLLAPALIGLLLLLIAGLAGNRAGMAIGIVSLVGCVALWAASASHVLTWDGQWGWRTVLVLIVAPLWLACSASASTRLWPGKSVDYRLRVLSAWVTEFTILYFILAAPVIEESSKFGVANEYWKRQMPKEPVPIIAGLGAWLLLQVALTLRAGSTLGCLLNGLQMMRNKSSAGRLAVHDFWRPLVREVVHIVEWLLAFLLAGMTLFTWTKWVEPNDMTVLWLTFAGPIVLSGLLSLILRRPLADRLAGIDYTPQSIASPDYSGLRKLFESATWTSRLPGLNIEISTRS